MKELYSMEFYVSSFDVGPTRQLKYSMLLRLLQESAGRQFEEEDLAYERLREMGLVFLLVRAAVRIVALPKAGETVTVETWFQRMEGAQFFRDMRVRSADGSILADCESVWIMANPQTHRILRPSSLPEQLNMPPRGWDRVEAHAGKTDAAGLALVRPAGIRKVRWSDIDCNGHMNNAVYADILCDFFPGGLLQQDGMLESFSVDFVAEAVDGDTIEISTGSDKNVEIYYEGVVSGRRCFAGKARLKQNAV